MDSKNQPHLLVRKRHELAQDAEILLCNPAFFHLEISGISSQFELVKKIRQDIVGYINQSQSNISPPFLSLNDLAEVFQYFSYENMQDFEGLRLEILQILVHYQESLTLKQLLILANYGGMSEKIESLILQRVSEAVRLEAQKFKRQATAQDEVRFAQANKMLMSLKTVVHFGVDHGLGGVIYKPSSKMREYVGLFPATEPKKSFEVQKQSKRSKSEKKVQEILTEMGAKFEFDVGFEGMFQLDFLLTVDKNDAQPPRQIALEVNGQYHLNSNGIFHFPEQRRLLRKFELAPDGSLHEKNGEIDSKDLILNLKTTRKYTYLLKKGLEVVSLDSRLLHEANSNDIRELLLEVIKI